MPSTRWSATQPPTQDLRQALAGTGITVAAGPDAVVEAAALPADWTMAAITGAAGLAPTLAAIRRGGVVALANKEALVCAGDVMLRAVQGCRRHAAAGRFRAQRDLPVDGGRQSRRGGTDRADRLGRPVPHRQPRGNGRAPLRKPP